jgi:hypothetical protein
MTPPTHCPKCGNGDTDNSFSGVVVFGCFSSACRTTGHFEQRPTCERRERDNLIAQLGCREAELELKLIRLEWQVGKLLDHCPDAECMKCGEIMCPHGEALHFHHDGCPQCDT